MKTKLLKIVRKRFVITRIDELASNDKYNTTTSELIFKHGLPIYRIYDKWEQLIDSSVFCKEYSDAKDFVLGLILKSYKEKFKHRDRKETKIWYKND